MTSLSATATSGPLAACLCLAPPPHRRHHRRPARCRSSGGSASHPRLRHGYYSSAATGQYTYSSMNNEKEMLSFWRNFHHWLHRKLSKWQLSVRPVMKISSKRHFRFGGYASGFVELCFACGYISLKFVSKVPIKNSAALFQIIVRRWPGGKPLSETMVSLLTHICVTQPQRVNIFTFILHGCFIGTVAIDWRSSSEVTLKGMGKINIS